MNKERMLQLAAHLRTMEKHFDLDYYFCVPIGRDHEIVAAQEIHKCGTVACIAGHAAVLANPLMSTRRADDNAHATAEEWLGLDGYQADELFIPVDIIYSKVTAAIAADVVENFANTGDIVWPKEVYDEVDN